MIDLRNSIIKKEIPVKENPNEIVDIVGKILHFNKQQNGKGLSSNLASVAKVFGRTRIKVLTPKQMLQRLPIVLVQVKSGNTSENLLNEIRQIIN